TWGWRNRIPQGKLTIIQGNPGEGKTWTVLDYITHVSRGKKFCDGAPCTRGEALFVTAEDDPADTIRPRLDLLGADVSKVHFFDGVRLGNKDVALELDRHVGYLDVWLASHRDVRVIAMDPLA